MASPKKLVECVAELLGSPVATVTVHDRNLAMAGLRTVGGRGRAVAHVNPTDGVNLLLAVITSDQVRHSVSFCQKFGSFVSKGSQLSGEFSNILKRRHTLRDGLVEIIELLCGDALMAADRFYISAEFKLQSEIVNIELKVGDIEIELQYVPMDRRAGTLVQADLLTTQRVTGVTLRSIAAVIRERNDSH